MKLIKGWSLLSLVTLMTLVSGMKIILHSSLGGRSHIKGVLEIGSDLVNRGHSVSYVGFQDNLKFVDGYNISTHSLGYPGLIKKDHPRMLDEYTRGLKGEAYQNGFVKVLIRWMVECYNLELQPLREMIIELKPDVLVCDFFAVACHDLAESYQIPLIVGIQSVDGLGIIDAEYITKTLEYGPLSILNMNMWDKFKATLYSEFLSEKFWTILTEIMNQQRLSNQMAIKTRLQMQGSLHYGLVLSNSYIGFETAMNIPPNIKLVGPLLSKLDNNLPDQYHQFLKDRPTTLFIAFGSHVTLDNSVIEIILHSVLEAIESNLISGVIWGLGQTKRTSFPTQLVINGNPIQINNHPHLMINDWSPQPQLLNHPHIKCFLSHGGLESSFESIHAGTPLLVLPYLGDQPRNARKIVDMGIGKFLDPLHLTSTILTSHLHYVITDPHQSILANLIRMKTISHTASSLHRPQASLIIEDYVITSKNCRPLLPYSPPHPPCELSHLLPATFHLPKFQTRLLDLYLTLLTITLTITLTLIYLTYNLIRHLRARWFNLTTTTTTTSPKLVTKPKVIVTIPPPPTTIDTDTADKLHKD